MLGGLPGELLCRGQDSLDAFPGGKVMTRFGEFDQSLFAPFLIVNVHRFRNSVRKKHHQVSGFMRKPTSLIPLREKPDHRAASFQTERLVLTPTLPQDYGWV